MISKNADKLPNMHSTKFRGLPIVIEWPKGSTRVGEKEDGTPYRTEMKADYGYVNGTDLAPDDGKLDVYIGPNEDAEYAYAIEQLKNDGSFDEWKVMLGFDSLEEAQEMYLAHNDEGWEEDHVGDVTEVPLDYLFDLVSENTGKPIEKEANQPDLFHPIEYTVENTNEHIAVLAKLRNNNIVIGELYMGFIGKGTEIGGIYDAKVFVKGLEKRNIAPEQIWTGLCSEMLKSARERGVKFIKDNLADKRYWREAGGQIIGQDSGSVKIKVAGEHTLIEAFIKNYEHEVDFYQEVAGLVQDKLDTALQDAGIKAVVSSRAKRPSRLAKKLEARAPKKNYQTFRDIYDDVVDLAGCRVALYMPNDREAVGKIISSLFTEIRPVKHFPADRGPEDSLGYVADHYLVILKPETLRKKELRYADTHVEIQVASVLMHAWAEVTHDLLYKPEKGQLTHEELKILKDLNDLVQTGESQLVKLQNAIEGRTSEDLRFDIVAALKHLAQPNLTVEDFKKHASKIAGKEKPNQWNSYLDAQRAVMKARKQADELDERLKMEFAKNPAAPALPSGPDDHSWYQALQEIGHGRKFDELTKEEQSKVIRLAQTLKSKA